MCWMKQRSKILDEAKMELNPYLDSSKDRYSCDYIKHGWWHNSCSPSVIEAVTGEAGDAGINGYRCSDGLMVLGVFISDGRSWCHVFQPRETVNACRFIAAMHPFFAWLRAAGIEDNRY